ncbi:MAG: glycosyltransferase [Oscillospiraceae bacterium]|nr:glycosyltransferase [Oscillospiraceae bacterium]
MLLVTAKALGIAAGIVWAVCLGYQAVLWAASRVKRGRGTPLPERLNRYGVLISARNEEAVLPQLIQSLREQDYPQPLIHIYVVADNCTDGTAQAARAAGATVYERFNLAQVGKGYALEWLLERIREEGTFRGYDGFFIFDADNLLAPDYIRRMNQTFSAGYSAVTSPRNSKNFGADWISHGYTLWFLHESQLLNRGRMALGSCCMVSGTGYVVSHALLDRAGGWPFHLMTEDAEFTAWCAVNGVKVGYCQEAVFYDEQPDSLRASWNQRLRWVKGYMQMLNYYGGRLLRGMFQRGGLVCADMLLAYLPSFIGAALSCLASVTLALWLLTSGGGWAAVAGVLALGTAQLLGGMLLLGLYTTVSQRRIIPLSAGEKLGRCLTFPLFMATYLPVAAAAMFVDVGWRPIPHTPVPERPPIQPVYQLPKTG